MHSVQGSCHCGNISYAAEFKNKPSSYTPRACDCKLCSSHGAAYASDSDGTLTIYIKNEHALNKYRQGSRIADFLICTTCGVMTGVCYQENGKIYGSINVRSVNPHDVFSAGQITQPEKLSDEERIKLWKKYWFTDVVITYEPA